MKVASPQKNTPQQRRQRGCWLQPDNGFSTETTGVTERRRAQKPWGNERATITFKGLPRRKRCFSLSSLRTLWRMFCSRREKEVPASATGQHND
jgi:hypothetical protein